MERVPIQKSKIAVWSPFKQASSPILEVSFLNLPSMSKIVPKTVPMAIAIIKRTGISLFETEDEKILMPIAMEQSPTEIRRASFVLSLRNFLNKLPIKEPVTIAAVLTIVPIIP